MNLETTRQSILPDRKMSMIIPVYFNADTISTLVDELCKFEGELAKLGVTFELIFVDDGSEDSSLDRLLQFRRVRSGTKVIRLTRNFGAPAAVKTGLQFVSGDCFMFFAADLQEPLEQVLRMVECWLAGHKYVISVRSSRADPWTTRFFAKVFVTLIRFTVRSDYPYGGVGMMLMDRVMLKPMLGSAKNVNPNVYAFWLGFEPKILYYKRQKRIHGRSRWTFQKRFQYMVDTITGFSIVPLRLMSAIGFLSAFGSFLYAVDVFVASLAGRIPVSGFATIMIVTAFLGGCILIMLGIIGEYLWRIFNHVSGMPEAVIAEEHL